MSFANLGLGQGPDGGLQIVTPNGSGSVLDTLQNQPGMYVSVADGSHPPTNGTVAIGNVNITSFQCDGRSNYFRLTGSLTFTLSWATIPTLVLSLGTATAVGPTSFSITTLSFVGATSGASHTFALDIIGAAPSPTSTVYLNMQTNEGVTLSAGAWTTTSLFLGDVRKVMA